MLNIYSCDPAAVGRRTHRRDFLRIGALGMGSLSLGWFLQQQALAESSDFLRDRSVVLLFLSGGAPHIETFDPKMDAPREYRSVTGAVSTKIPGVQFGGTFPKLASMADRLAVVRSFHPCDAGDHNIARNHVISGGTTLKANFGSMYSRLAGTNNRATGIPNSVFLTPHAAGSSYRYLGQQGGSWEALSSSGNLSGAYRPFDPGGANEAIDNLTLQVSQRRLEDRQMLLSQLDRLRKRIDHSSSFQSQDHIRQQAIDVVLRGVSDSFDLSKEPQSVLDAYDTSNFKVPPNYPKTTNVSSFYEPVALGRQMLLARRLCESGCRFVTVVSEGWDLHADKNNVGIEPGMQLYAPAVDQAVSAFIEDVKQRGLTEKILLVITSEFGRSPRLNDRGGREHWSQLGLLAFAGGGLRMGQVIGTSDRMAAAPASNRVTSKELMGTIMHSLLDMTKLRSADGSPRELMTSLQQAHPIPELV